MQQKKLFKLFVSNILQGKVPEISITVTNVSIVITKLFTVEQKKKAKNFFHIIESDYFTLVKPILKI